MVTARCLVVLGSALLALACGETDQGGGGSGGAAGSGAGASSVGSGGAVAGGNGSAGGAGSSGRAGAAGTAGVGNTDPTLCGGAYPAPCAEGKVCVFDSGCGTVGHCVRIPSGCDENYAPVCGCDGKTYGNECGARLAGTAVGSEGECPATFECGPYRCAVGQYCVDKAEQADGPWRYGCLALPEACSGQASCACVESFKGCFGGFTCSSSSDTVTLVCR